MYMFTEDEIKELNKYKSLQKNYTLKKRFLSLLLLNETADIALTCRFFDTSLKSVNRWYTILKEKGVSYLNSFQYTGKKRSLNKDQLKQFKNWVGQENPSCRELAVAYIKENFGVEYALRTISDIMSHLGLKFLKPKTTPGKGPDLDTQYDFIKTYEQRNFFQAHDTGIVQLFCDGAHLVHQVSLGFCWGDPKNIPVFPTNTSRNRLNILGAYDPKTLEFTHLTSENAVNATQVIEFLELIKKTYKNKHSIILYLDNAKYFKAVIVREWLKKNLEIHLSFLPTYSPNLNLIERLWRFVKKKLVKNRYHSKYKIFRAKTFQLLNNLHEYSNEISSLITENFQIIDRDTLNIKEN